MVARRTWHAKPELLDELPECGTRVQSARPAKGPARVLMPNRLPIELRPSDLESLDRVAFGAYSEDLTLCYGMTDVTVSFSVRPSFPTWGKFHHPCDWEILNAGH
ncbi:MAG: hypothetical protein USCGTAYLOR_00485 [Chromatiales bacterium USCg_Taylor]|nr:MAG: hypothetical protein USCGTAYLOR_00485 [Chromatiales bacterium USCg_Taylor]